MKRVKYFADGFWVRKHLVQWVTTIMIMIYMGLGSVIIAGGINRFPEPSYQPLIDYSNGRIWIWGIWICIAGICMSTPFRWINIIGLWLGMFWCVIWMTCFTIAAIHFDSSATTPIPVYGGLSLISAALLTARVIERTEE